MTDSGLMCEPAAAATEATAGARRSSAGVTPRIAIVLPSLEAGGAERINLRLAAALLGHGYEVDVVAVRAFGGMRPLVPQGARLIDLDKPRMSLAVAALARYLRENRPAVTIGVLDSMSVIGLLARRLARSRTKFIAQSHSSPKHLALPARFGLVTLMRLLYPGADAVVVPGATGLARHVADCSGRAAERIDEIPNGLIDADLAARAAEPLTWWPPEDEGEKTLIAVGRLHAVKSYPLLIEAMAILRDRGVSCRLLVAGEGEERRRIEEMLGELQLADRVMLLGFVPNPLPLIRRADLLVVASRSEGMPTVIIEALSCGTPVVSTDCEFGPAFILGDGRWGGLAPVGDAAALAGAIETALAERREPEALEARASEFTVEKMGEAYVRLIERLLAGDRGSEERAIACAND